MAKTQVGLLLAASLAAAIGVACGGSDERIEEFEDVGSLCVSQSGSYLLVTAYAPMCRGGEENCGRSLSGFNCAAGARSEGIVVSSRLEYRVDTSPGRNCTTDSCTPSPPLVMPCGNVPSSTAASQTVIFGNQSALLELPLERPTALFGTHGPCAGRE